MKLLPPKPKLITGMLYIGGTNSVVKNSGTIFTITGSIRAKVGQVVCGTGGANGTGGASVLFDAATQINAVNVTDESHLSSILHSEPGSTFDGPVMQVINCPAGTQKHQETSMCQKTSGGIVRCVHDMGCVACSRQEYSVYNSTSCNSCPEGADCSRGCPVQAV